MVRMRSVGFPAPAALPLLLLAFAALAPPGALAETASTQRAEACGATVSEGLEHVEDALKADDPASQRQALICLSRVVAAMNIKIGELDDRVDQRTVMHAPVTTAPIKDPR